MSLARLEFQFMGYSDIRGVLAGGMNAGDDVRSANLAKSISEAKVARK